MKIKLNKIIKFLIKNYMLSLFLFIILITVLLLIIENRDIFITRDDVCFETTVLYKGDSITPEELPYCGREKYKFKNDSNQPVYIIKYDNSTDDYGRVVNSYTKEYKLDVGEVMYINPPNMYAPDLTYTLEDYCYEELDGPPCMGYATFSHSWRYKNIFRSFISRYILKE